jgi:serine/threonine-protein kinase
MANEYRLGRKLGEGGFGAVYEAEHPLLKRRAAVKVLHQVAGLDSDAVLRFISEAQAVNQIKNRHIIDVFSFGKLTDGRHFYVMDLLEGEPLDRFLERVGRCEVPATIQLLRPITEALDAAHAAGIVHRDLKPQNIYLTWEPNGNTVPKLLDFGMAKLLSQSPVHTASGTPIGTPLYMSPEQTRGDKVDGRSDVYSFGVLCHELLTGQMPITGESTVVVLVAQLMQAPKRVSEALPELSPELDSPILRMLDKDPTQRPTSLREAMAELIEAATRAGYSIPDGPPKLPPPPPRSEPEPEVPAMSISELGRALTPDAEERQGLVRSMDGRSTRKRGAGLPLFGVLLAVTAGAAYYATGAMKASVQPAASATFDVSAAAPSETPRIPPAETPSAVASVALPTPRSVALVLRGAPAGAQVWLNGAVLGSASDPLSLPFGEAELKLTVTAKGFEPHTLELTPNHDVEEKIKLKKRATSAPSAASIPRDLESPF